MTSVAIGVPPYDFSTDPLAAPRKIDSAQLQATIISLYGQINALNQAVSQLIRDDNALEDASVPYRSLAPDVLSGLSNTYNLNLKVASRLAATVNANIAAAPANFDGVAAVAGDRIVLAFQSNQTENGIYVFNGAGVAMTRATDANTGALLVDAYTVVTAGTTQHGWGWQVTNSVITLGSDLIQIAPISSTVTLVHGNGGGGTSVLDWLSVKTFGALGDGVSHPLSSGSAAQYNALYGSYGLAVVAGDENDYAAIMACLLVAANTGQPAYVPVGVYRTNKPLTLSWTATPISGQPVVPAVTRIMGAGYASQIKGTIATAGRAIIELLGESNGNAVNCELSHLRLTMSGGSALAYCLRVGDSWVGFRALRVACEGANGCLLKVASSVSYAELCTVFEQCRFMSNYLSGWFANDNLATVFAFAVETGGSYWDNVAFRSCVFLGLVLPRAFISCWDNCQFYVNPGRPNDGVYDYAYSVFITLGAVSFFNSYFEDHKIAIAASPFTADITSVTIRDCHFSGVTNFAGQSANVKYAIQITGGVAGDIGPVSIENIRIYSAGYTQKAIQLIGVTGHETGTHNINAPGIAINRDYQFSNMLVEERLLPGGVINTIPIGQRTSTYLQDNAKRFQATNSDLDAFYTPGGVKADSGFYSSFHKATRIGTGVGNSESWGYSIGNAGNTDTLIINWASTTYTVGGALAAWVVNDNPFMYVPAGKTFLIGFGAASQVPITFASNMITSPGGYTASSTDYTSIGNVPQVLRFTIGYAALANASTSSGITLFQLQPKQFIMAVFIKHSVAFAGGAISAYTLALGAGAFPNKYLPAFDVHQAVGDTVVGGGSAYGWQGYASLQNITLTATSAGANTNAATAGTAEIWCLIGKLP